MSLSFVLPRSFSLVQNQVPQKRKEEKRREKKKIFCKMLDGFVFLYHVDKHFPLRMGNYFLYQFIVSSGPLFGLIYVLKY